MYRSSKTNRSSSSTINDECTGSESSLELTNSPSVSAQPCIRSTSQILNLIKRPTGTTKQETCVKISSFKPLIDNSPKNQEKQLAPHLVTHDKIVFNVLIGKKSTRKHKVWDGDGTLEVTGKNATLKSSDGNVLGRTSVDPATLEEGFRLSMNSKEVEIVDKVSGVILSTQDLKNELVQEPPLKKQKVLPKKAVLPLGPRKKESHPLVMPSTSSMREELEICSGENLSEQEVSVVPCLADGLRPHEREGVVLENTFRVFNVLIGKKSTRKHKVWDEDGTLEVTGKNATLKNLDGNVLGRTSVDPATLEEGFRLSISNKEVEIVDNVSGVIRPTQHLKKELVQEPPLRKQKVLPKKAFVSLGPTKKESHPLVMPTISSMREWSEDCSEENLSEQEVSVTPCLADVLRPHQREGVVFLYQCIMGMQVPNFFGAILADEMGLGKTLQCITILWTLMQKGPYGKSVIKRALVVTPSSLCGNWDREFARWLGYHRISPYVVNAKRKAKDFITQMRNPVMIISYDMLIRSFKEIEEISFDLLICDEGHRLKNTDIKAAKVLSGIDCKRRILLTGTPVQNDLQEFFALIDFVNPGILSTSQEYKGYYEGPIVASRCPHASESAQSMGKERAEELHKKTSLFILRRTQETINKYLPSKHEIIVFCQLSEDQERLYVNTTDKWFSNAVLPQKNVPHLTVITALKKICNHSNLVDKENESPKFPIGMKHYDGKVSVVQTIMRNLRKTDEKLVLISYFTQTLDLLEELCNKENFKFLRLDGSTSTKLRSKIVEQFNRQTDDHQIFLLSAKAGGVGLNLPGASRLVLFDSDWNPASDSQAMARIWRDGQKKDVYIYRLLSTGTIEEKIFQRQISKSGLSETVVDSKSFASLKFSMAELKDLFTLTTNTDCLTHDMMKCPCNGRQTKAVVPKEIDEDDLREFQLVLENDVPKRNVTINHLLEWEHYVQPVPTKIMQDIMLEEISRMVTFVFKNSVYQGTK